MITVAALALGAIAPRTAFAHPGGTDARGCHTCRTNCPSYGLSTGEYHCHGGSGGSSSGGTSPRSTPVPFIPAPSTPRPAAPVPTAAPAFNSAPASRFAVPALAAIANTGGSGVALRYDCNADARLGGALSEGADVAVTHEGIGGCDGWSIVEGDGSRTWVRDEYLLLDSTPTPEVAAAQLTPSPTATPTVLVASAATPEVRRTTSPAATSPGDGDSSAGTATAGLMGLAALGGAGYWLVRRVTSHDASRTPSLALPTGAAFASRPLPEPSLLDRARRRPPKDGALVELENRLASATSPREVSAEEVSALSQRYEVDMPRTFSKQFERMYERYAAQRLVDRHLDESELADLRHLKLLFGLTDARVDVIHNRLAQALYHEDIRAAVADGRIDPDERRALERLREELRLPDSLAERIYREAASARLREAVSSAIADQRLTPDEDQELEAIAASLGMALSADEETRQALDRYRQYWVIENGDLPPVPVDIRLQRKETCYFVADVSWYEHRTVTKRMRYGGPTARIRIAKGVYFRVGEVAFQPVTEDVLKLIDTGTLYLTSKRLLFTGKRGNKTLPLARIIDFEVYKNGVDVQKDAGKNPFLEFEDDLDLFALTLDRVLREA